MIEVQSLTKTYGGFRAVDDVSFTIRPGEVVGLLGPNGAGKTTIMKVLTCFHYPSLGSVSIFNNDVYKDDTAIKNILGYLPENAPHYPEFKVREYLIFVAAVRIGKGTTPSGLNAAEAVDKAIESCSLQDVASKLIDELSKGYKQRLGLAQAILHEPQLLILDEPTTGLDPNQILEIRRLIRELKKDRTIILSTHILQEVEAVCDRVLILNQGKIVAQGSSQEIADELRGEAVFELVVAKADSTLQSALENLAGVRKVETDTLLSALVQDAPANAAVLGYRVRISREAGASWDFRNTCASLVSKHGGVLVHLVARNASLEDLFVRLTGGEQSNV